MMTACIFLVSQAYDELHSQSWAHWFSSSIIDSRILLILIRWFYMYIAGAVVAGYCALALLFFFSFQCILTVTNLTEKDFLGRANVFLPYFWLSLQAEAELLPWKTSRNALPILMISAAPPFARPLSCGPHIFSAKEKDISIGSDMAPLVLFLANFPAHSLSINIDYT